MAEHNTDRRLWRHSRITIQDGEVVTYALRFRDGGPGVFGRHWDPAGPFEVSVSRYRILVHGATIETEDDALWLRVALAMAMATKPLLHCGEMRYPEKDPTAVPWGYVHQREGIPQPVDAVVVGAP